MSERTKATADFERLLKSSHYLNSIIASHREATADILAAFISLLAQSSALEPARVAALLSTLDQSMDRPSDDSTRRVLIQALREKLQQL
ncbi:hypothetical protein [Burkholderia perseverans]|uniref:hypothetical protein n=1 Tax=Burkholderia perseverans TaxID=2615214 RepID=UPI001FEF3E64|nr:hypothetical protein [Burkholderia perseverans]